MVRKDVKFDEDVISSSSWGFPLMFEEEDIILEDYLEVEVELGPRMDKVILGVDMPSILLIP